MQIRGVFRSLHEHDAAISFSDVTLKVAGAAFMVSFSIADVEPCESDPVTVTLCPRCLRRSTPVPVKLNIVGAIDLDQLRRLEGLGLPKLDLEQSKDKAAKDKAKDKPKPDEN
jgi:hypothetical protein